ncbi:hypothetical protein LIER_40324 [Lithospermum erythrorhizon]|uniref:Retrotransposon gag domain-containing protein n=1 Tax=Lithospermum erythrorhizon TaxID=34254 RepID=A0AAV3QTY1_LITER
MVVCGRDKFGYLTGDFAEPLINHSKYRSWQAENSMVMAWLVNSVADDISNNYMYFQIAKDIWNDCKVMYFDVENTSQKREIVSQLQEFKQGHLSMTKYYTDLKKIWQ